MWETILKVLPYVLIGGAGVVVWTLLSKGVPAAGSAVKSWWTKAETDVKALEARVVAIEVKLGLRSAATGTTGATPAAHVTGPVGATGTH